ncbi:MAG: hypothetical protein ABIB71_07215 [Candidatus Woesearchaeota archaeon]
MHSFNKRGSEKVFNTIIGMVLLLIFLTVALVVIYNVFNAPAVTQNTQGMACYVTNGLSSSPILGLVMPTICNLQEEEEPVGMEKLAELLVASWFMYGKGRWDIKVSDSGYAVYSFKVKEEFKLYDLFQYLSQHEDGESSSYKDSDYNYFQKGSKGQSICIDDNVKGPDLTVFKPGVQYYILFYDDSGLDDCGDKLVISVYPNDEQGKPYHCISHIAKESHIISADNKCHTSDWSEL